MWKEYSISVWRQHSFSSCLPELLLYVLGTRSQYLGFLFSSFLKWFWAGISYWAYQLADNLDCFHPNHIGSSGTRNISWQFQRESPYSLPPPLSSIEVSFSNSLFFISFIPLTLHYSMCMSDVNKAISVGFLPQGHIWQTHFQPLLLVLSIS